MKTNKCPKCGLYYNPIIEGSIPVNGCKCNMKKLKVHIKKKKYLVSFDFESKNKEIAKTLNRLEMLIEKGYGEPCKHKAVGCSTCQAWANFYALKMCLF